MPFFLMFIKPSPAFGTLPEGRELTTLNFCKFTCDRLTHFTPSLGGGERVLLINTKKYRCHNAHNQAIIPKYSQRKFRNKLQEIFDT